ncbi:hypothetical protein [Macrococcoides caseolyticum]|uniref:hypothetical protein n=1 Tax=Macrococcoides caseolyticum TaxID=69966 RepID=UPI000C33AC80|nr:hypothetical protein [Macrococcus caseolyticus]PKE17776.1 hypothetical protein CW718_01970 [Macrococcus caseolyticus]
MNIFEFYWELLKNNAYKLSTFDMLKDIYIPLLNVGVVFYIFRKGEKGRKEDQLSNFEFQGKLADKNNAIQKINNRPAFHFDRLDFDITVPMEYKYLSRLKWFNNDDELNLKEFRELMRNQKLELYLRNIGKGNAKNVVTTMNNINTIGYLSNNLDENLDGVNKLNEVEKYKIINSDIVVERIDGKGSYRKEINGEKVTTIYRNRVIPSNATQIIPLDFSDLLAFNYYIFKNDKKKVIPILRFHVQYSDYLNDGKEQNYEEYINIAISNYTVRSVYGKNIYEINIRIDELTEERIELFEREGKYKYFNQ